MPIKASCSCGHTFNAPSKYAGKKVKCPKCKEPLQIPAASSGAATKKPSKLVVQCTACSKKFAAKPEWAGKKVKCPACSEPVVIPGGKKVKAATAPPPPAPPESPLDSLFEEVGLADVETGGRKCPECKSAMKPDAILCIACGYNENLGRKMEVQRPVTAEERAKNASKFASESIGTSGGKQKASSGRSSGGSEGNMVMIAAGVPAALIGLSIVLNFVAPAQSGMVMLAATLVTGVIQLGGGLWLLSVAFSDSMVQGLLCLLIPFYGLFYVATHWEETKVPFLVSFLPGVVFAVGTVVMGALAGAGAAVG